MKNFILAPIMYWLHVICIVTYCVSTMFVLFYKKIKSNQRFLESIRAPRNFPFLCYQKIQILTKFDAVQSVQKLWLTNEPLRCLYNHRNMKRFIFLCYNQCWKRETKLNYIKLLSSNYIHRTTVVNALKHGTNKSNHICNVCVWI